MDIYIKLLEDITKRESVSFISSITKDGYPKTRAMLLPVKREDNVFWYHTNTSSQKVQQFRDNPKACIYFCDPASYTGIVFIGTMEVLEDQETKDRFWKDGYTMYYSKGATDPDFCVLKFTAQEGDYYGNFSVTKFEM